MGEEIIQPPQITREHLEHLALFPLPGGVFFPGTMLPLHVFEERYREMTREALEDGIPICVVKLEDPRQFDAQGRPLFHAIGGAGFILHHQKLPDGRYNILLEGTARVRILEEINSDKSYRVGRAEIIPDKVDLSGSVNALLTTLRGCVVGLRDEYERLSEAITKTMNNVADPGILANTIASIIIASPDARQALLSEPRVDARLDAIVTMLTDLLANSTNTEDSWLN